MVPPFLAYYGVVTQNRSLLEEAHTQISLYRNYLRDNSTGMWKHVLLGSADNDPGFWSTGALFLEISLTRADSPARPGNGWAAAGMLRVLMTMQQSQYANTFTSEQSDLASWVAEIHAAIYPHLVSRWPPPPMHRSADAAAGYHERIH